MVFNSTIIAVAALIPLVIGFIWYNPKVLGTAWMQACGLREEDLKGANMAVTFILTYVFSFFLGSVLTMLVIHQNGFFSTLMDNPDLMKEGTGLYAYAEGFMTKYGTNFRTFKHGALHGGMSGLFFVLPVLGTNALFERKGFKYIAINVGFWTVCLALMGGVICQFS